jgi:PKD repeat protein
MKKILWMSLHFFAAQINAKETKNIYNNNKTFLPTPPPDVANDTLFFDLQNAMYTFSKTENFVDIPIFVRSKGPVSSFDFRMKFNQTKLTYISTTNVEAQLQPFTSLNTNDNFLRNNTAGPSVSYVIPNNTTLVYVRFQINVPCTTISETDFFSITTLLVGYPCKNQVTPVTPITANTILTTSILSSGSPILFNGPTNTSGIPITSYSWNLGNGVTSTDKNVSTTYTEPGNYTAKLIVKTVEGCKDSITQVLNILTAGTASLDPSETVKIYPNPADGFLTIVTSVNAKINITDISGKDVLFSGKAHANIQQAINVSNLTNGTYLVKIYNESYKKVERIVINHK